MKLRVWVTRDLPGRALALLSGQFEINVWPHMAPPPRESMLENVRGMDGVLCTLADRIDETVMDAAGSSLKVISNYAVGFDNVDVSCATARGIPVGNTPGVLTETTADLAFGLMLAGARRLVQGVDYARSGKWEFWSPTLLLGQDVHGATLGIVGKGRIGDAVARRARGFDMEVIHHSRSGGVGFEELLERSDFVSLHVPLTDETRNMIGAAELKRMKSTAVLVNTARGGIVDHDALAAALERGQIGYAALDVTAPEPLAPDHRLYTLDNCMIVPHLGSASVATRSKMGEMAAANLIAGLKGDPLPTCVNPEVYSIG